MEHPAFSQTQIPQMVTYYLWISYLFKPASKINLNFSELSLKHIGVLLLREHG